MYYIEQIYYILSDMMKNKMRVFLTMIGIIVGVCSVVMIISVGFSATRMVELYFSGSLGSNRVRIDVYSINGTDDYNMTYNELMTLVDSDDMFLGALLESDGNVLGKVTIDETHYAPANLKGVSDCYSQAYQMIIEAGRFINATDSANVSSSVVISDIMAECCFDSVDNALGQSISISNDEGTLIDAVVVGVYKAVDSTGKLNRLKDKHQWVSNIYCSYEYFNKCMNIDTNNLKYDIVDLVVDNDVDVESAVNYTMRYCMGRFEDKEDYRYDVYSGYSQASDTNDTVYLLMLVFVAAAVLSLIVGGISLMNTMLVNVKERTKEIGTKKAIGASNADIVIQFVTESVMICLIACIVGIILSFILLFFIQQNLSVFFNMVTDDALRYFLNTSNISVTVNGYAVLISALFSITVGVTFGVYPALKAARMSITDALRYEL